MISRHRIGLVLGPALALLPALGGCVEHRDGITGTQSLQIELVAPTDPGTVDQRLPDTARMVTVHVTAKDHANQVDTSFEEPVRVYAQFLGTVTPDLNQMPLATLQMQAGVATDQSITLPFVYGPTTLWFDNGTGFGTDYEHGAIVGASETLWYRDPWIVDLQRPRDEMAVDALSKTPLTDKQINVTSSRYGARGRLVVTSVYAQGYTVADVECADEQGTPPCTSQAYDHMLVFTFSAPRDQYGRLLEVGREIRRFTGGLSEFNGLTEVGFPRTYAAEGPDETPQLHPERMPPPALFDPAWFGPLSSPDGMINFERNESGAIEIRGAKVCELDEEYTTFKQWKLDPAGEGGDCSRKRNVLNIITTGSDFATDPSTLVGRTLPRVVGILRPVNIGSFNVWIVFPRGGDDIDLQ